MCDICIYNEFELQKFAILVGISKMLFNYYYYYYYDAALTFSIYIYIYRWLVFCYKIIYREESNRFLRNLAHLYG
jgi:hypothetical protein